MSKPLFFGKAVDLYMKSLYSEAIELFEKNIQENPTHEESYFYAGRCCENMFFETKAIEYYLKGIKLCMDDEYISNYHLHIGNCYIKLSKLEKAIYHYDEAEKFQGNYLISQFNKAIAFMCKKDFIKALSMFESIRKQEELNVINIKKLNDYMQYCKDRISR